MNAQDLFQNFDIITWYSFLLFFWIVLLNTGYK